MSMLYFKKGCRDCNRSNGIQGMISGQNDLQHYQNLTDYEISQIIEKTLVNNNSSCEFCGGNNNDIYNIKVDDSQIFKLKELKKDYGNKGSFIFIYSMEKMNNQGNLIVDNGDSYPNTFEETQKFESKCKTAIQKLINSIPTTAFTHHSNGLFYMCFTGNETEIKLEKFRHTGFSQEALINITNNIARDPFA